LETHKIVEDLVTQEPKIFEEESVTLHHVAYNKNSKKLLIEKVNMKKKVSEKWKSEIDFLRVTPSKIVQLHEATGKALKESICNIEKENLILKEKIKKLETTLIMKPLFVEPLTTI
jgi:hypothetical protein